MKLRSILLIIYCSVILNSVILFVFGDKGFLEYQSLLTYKQTLEENIEKIKTKNKSLSNNLAMLTTSQEKIVILARERGYYKKQETPIVIDGYNPSNNFYEIGNLLNISNVSGERNPILRTIVICMTVCAFILNAVIYQRKKNGNQRF